MGNNIIEYFGFAASLAVAISLMMSNIIKLRVLNFIGAIMFVIYGFIIGSMPVAFMNLYIALINIYYLYKLNREKAIIRN